MGNRKSTKIGYTHYYYYAQFAKTATGKFLWSPVDQNDNGKLLPYVPNPSPNKKKK